VTALDPQPTLANTDRGAVPARSVVVRALQAALQALVRAYQLILRPVMPPLCRFYPSCSDYALEALAVHGPARGTALAVRRVCRCHPWNPGGVDLVPPPRVSSGPVAARPVAANPTRDTPEV
jgi:putative membrane protein insertion efficiency factor